MERQDRGRAPSEPAMGREKILCYINMQSPGRIEDKPLRGGLRLGWILLGSVTQRYLYLLLHFLRSSSSHVHEDRQQLLLGCSLS